MKKEKILIKVLIENDQLNAHEFNPNQKLLVLVNQTLEHFHITAENRELKREDGTPLTDLSRTIEEAGIRDGETLRYFKKASKPDRDKGFAVWIH